MPSWGRGRTKRTWPPCSSKRKQVPAQEHLEILEYVSTCSASSFGSMYKTHVEEGLFPPAFCPKGGNSVNLRSLPGPFNDTCIT